MKAEKIRNLTDDELKHQERDLADQLFKLKFQMNMGQTESLKKIRGLRRDIARVQTIRREQELAAAGTKTGSSAATKTATETKTTTTTTGTKMTTGTKSKNGKKPAKTEKR
jgi:large subunit ribosomal protein L29